MEMESFNTRDCDICLAAASSKDNDNGSIGKLETQLNVIFVFRHIFEVKPEELGSLLETWGNPENWVNLCEKCEEDVASIRRIFERLCEIKREFRRAKYGLQERKRVAEEIRTSQKEKHNVHDHGPDSGDILESRSSSWSCRRQLMTTMSRSTNPLKDGDVHANELALQLKPHIKKEDVDIESENPVDGTDANEVIFPLWDLETVDNYDYDHDHDHEGMDVSTSVIENGEDDCNLESNNSTRTSGSGDINGDGDSSNNSDDTHEDYSPPPKPSSRVTTLGKRSKKLDNSYYSLEQSESTELNEDNHNQEDIPLHPCPQEGCSKSFRSDLAVRRHIRRYHRIRRTRSKRKYSCPRRGNKFWNKSNLEEHLDAEICRGNKSNSNANVDNIGSELNEERNHNRNQNASSTATASIPCPKQGCSKLYGSIASVRSHILRHHRADHSKLKKYLKSNRLSKCRARAPPKPIPQCGHPSSSLLPSFEVDMSKFTHTPENPVGFCNICGKHIKQFKRFRDHMRAAHHKEEVCTICGETLKSLEAIRVHLEKVHGAGDFKCKENEKECKEVFLSEARLIKHKRLVHSSEPRRIPTPSKCEICGKEFPFRENLNRHVEIVHERKFERICPICFIRISLRENFRVHMKSVHKLKNEDFVIPPPLSKMHPDEREKLIKKAEAASGKKKPKIICHHCGKELKTEKGLTWHMQYMHEKTKPVLICDVEGCIKSFINEKLLLNHKREYHEGGPRVEPKCVCQYCGKEFRNRKRARTHELRIHPEDSQPIKCEVKGCGQGFSSQRNLNQHLKTAHNIDVNISTNGDEVKNGGNS